MIRHGVHGAAVLIAAACAGHLAPPPSASSPASDAPAAAGAPLAPDAVPALMILDVTLPPAGRSVGSHLEGALYSQRAGSIELTDGLRLRWSRLIRTAGDSILRAAGYNVRSLGAPTSDAEPLRDVRFGLSVDVGELTVETTGRVAPILVAARADAVWEVLDLAAGGVILAVRTHGSARLTDSVDQAAVLAVRRSLESLAADTSFRRALSSPVPHSMADAVFGPAWGRALPGPFDTLRIGNDDLNVAAETDPVQRVAYGVFALHGTSHHTVNGFTITRDGLALSADVPVRERRLWARFHDGVDRPVRILRSRDGIALLEVSCSGPCMTVPWSATATPRDQDHVFTLGGTRYAGDAMYLATGQLHGSDGTELRIHGDLVGGEPVALREDGTVIALSARGRAVPLGEALRVLGLALRAP
ncbi:MAG: hypothetical protein ACHQX4_03485 [Gemmatimonadales bacterium]